MNTATAARVDTILELEPKPAMPPTVVQQGAMATITPADLLRNLMERGGEVDMERAERLMAMQERFLQMQEGERKREAELAFRRDFAGFRGENVIVPKSKHVDRGRAGSFYQAEFEGVCRLLSPALSKHGFGFRHDMRFGSRKWTTDGVENDMPWVYVTCYLEHRAGHAETLELEGPTGDGQANTPVQNMQTTASFLKRQSLLAITGTATGGEDDEARMKHNAKSEDRRDDFEELLDAGRNAAIEGSKALTAWWAGLDNKGRSLMNKEFAQLRKDAAKSDKPVDHSKEAARV